MYGLNSLHTDDFKTVWTFVDITLLEEKSIFEDSLEVMF